MRNVLLFLGLNFEKAEHLGFLKNVKIIIMMSQCGQNIVGWAGDPHARLVKFQAQFVWWFWPLFTAASHKWFCSSAWCINSFVLSMLPIVGVIACNQRVFHCCFLIFAYAHLRIRTFPWFLSWNFKLSMRN